MFSRLRKDIQVIKDRDPAAKNVAEILLCYAGLHAIWAHRLSHFFTVTVILLRLALFPT